MKGLRPATDELSYITQEIREVRKLCGTDFGGRWELRHLPFSGGYWEQPDEIISRIELIITCVNNAIADNKSK